MPEKGRVAVLHRSQEVFEFRESIISEVEAGAILVQITAVNICGSHLHIWRGDLESGNFPGTGPRDEWTGLQARIWCQYQLLGASSQRG